MVINHQPGGEADANAAPTADAIGWTWKEQPPVISNQLSIKQRE
jgi:hypothetical protein